MRCFACIFCKRPDRGLGLIRPLPISAHPIACKKITIFIKELANNNKPPTELRFCLQISIESGCSATRCCHSYSSAFSAKMPNCAVNKCNESFLVSLLTVQNKVDFIQLWYNNLNSLMPFTTDKKVSFKSKMSSSNSNSTSRMSLLTK